MKYKRISLPLLALIFLLSGCAGQSKPVSGDTFAMDSYMQLTAHGPKASAAVAQALATLGELDAALSATDEGSEIYAYNQGDTTTLSPATQALVDKGLAIGERTGGALDITIYPLVRAWGFTTDAKRVPTQAEIVALLAAPSTQLDLGALGKGYAGDVLAEQMRDAGVSSALLTLSGNIHCVGAKPDGSAWKIAIQDPQNASAYLGAVSVENKAVVTSGGYERCFELDGKTYHHIIDPATGYPAESGLTSVTIVADSGTLADGLSTALFVMGLERALAHYEAHQDFEAILVTDDHQVYLTAGLGSAFELLSGDYELMELLP